MQHFQAGSAKSIQSHNCINIKAVGAGGAAVSPIKSFLDKIDLIWANLVRFGRNLGKSD